MKKLFLIALCACGLSSAALAQTDYEHAQARILEATSDFFVRPMVAELKMIKDECQEYGPFNIYPGRSISEMNYEFVKDAKVNAAYKAAMLAGADVILGATFYVVNNKTKTKGLDVTVRGYPAKYVNFHNFGDPVKGKEDEKWVNVLLENERTRKWDPHVNTEQSQTKAVSTDTRNR